MSSASSRFRSDQAPSRAAAHVRFDRFSRDVSDRGPPARGLMAQFRIEIIGKLHGCASHGYASIPTAVANINVGMEREEGVVPRDGVEPPTRGFSVRCSTN